MNGNPRDNDHGAMMMKGEISNGQAKYGMMLDDVFQKIKLMMYQNQLVPGQKIIYADLASQLRTSTTPVIQALKRLETSQIVRYVPNKGYFVREVTEAEARELYEARESIELVILPKIVKRITDNEIDELKGFLRGLHIKDPRKWGMFDEQLHLGIAKYAKNDVIYDLLKEIFDRIYLRYKLQYLSEERLRESVEEHREIFVSLARRDLKSLRKVVKGHIARQFDYTLRFMLQ